jgi:pimeloyl-ACP methyl ester carboxylesterase
MTLQLFWDRAGKGEPLLLLHGIGSTHDDFSALRPRLDAEYRVLAPDLPGHGHSRASARSLGAVCRRGNRPVMG